MKNTKFDPRKMMELAIEVMKQSVAEPRTDGKPTPLVGAVIWKPDGTVETACRGELREGDHAEFTLLERKNRDARLDGSKLFCTLEPCAPGSRHHPKLDCSERIVLARIKEVWVGIGDLDPTVDRKGIEHLEKNGITVHMFDRDLQEAIEAENKDFIAQALDRAALAAEERKKPKSIILSKLEGPVPVAPKEVFSTEALERYRADAKIDESVESEGFFRRLLLQGIVKEEGARLVPTGFGVVLFGKQPRDAMPQAGLLGTIHYSDRKEETRDFDGPAVFAPEQALQWLRDKLPNPIDRTQARRREAHEAFFELVREGIGNALIHRDYGIEQAKCQLVANPDSVLVMSPGSPVPPITLEQLQAFDAPMLSRNPVLHYVFAKMELAEERGLGLKSMRRGAEGAGLPLPKYAWKDPYLLLTLYRSAKGAATGLKPEVLEALSKAERSGWEWLVTKDKTKSSEYAAALNVDERTGRRHLNRFVELGLVRKSGSGPATKYELL